MIVCENSLVILYYIFIESYLKGGTMPKTEAQAETPVTDNNNNLLQIFLKELAEVVEKQEQKPTVTLIQGEEVSDQELKFISELISGKVAPPPGVVISRSLVKKPAAEPVTSPTPSSAPQQPDASSCSSSRGGGWLGIW